MIFFSNLITIIRRIDSWQVRSTSGSMNPPNADYKKIIDICKDIYLKKSKDYGSAWRILRAPSLTDQIFIKAQRIRSIDDKGVQKINESIDSEFMGILNYSIIALIQLSKTSTLQPDMDLETSLKLYAEHADTAKKLMEQKRL